MEAEVPWCGLNDSERLIWVFRITSRWRSIFTKRHAPCQVRSGCGFRWRKKVATTAVIIVKRGENLLFSSRTVFATSFQSLVQVGHRVRPQKWPGPIGNCFISSVVDWIGSARWGWGFYWSFKIIAHKLGNPQRIVSGQKDSSMVSGRHTWTWRAAPTWSGGAWLVSVTAAVFIYFPFSLSWFFIRWPQLGHHRSRLQMWCQGCYSPFSLRIFVDRRP